MQANAIYEITTRVKFPGTSVEVDYVETRAMPNNLDPVKALAENEKDWRSRFGDLKGTVTKIKLVGPPRLPVSYTGK